MVFPWRLWYLHFMFLPLFCVLAHESLQFQYDKVMLATQRMQCPEDANVNYSLDSMHKVVRQRHRQW